MGDNPEGYLDMPKLERETRFELANLILGKNVLYH